MRGCKVGSCSLKQKVRTGSLHSSGAELIFYAIVETSSAEGKLITLCGPIDPIIVPVNSLPWPRRKAKAVLLQICISIPKCCWLVEGVSFTSCEPATSILA